MVKFLGPTAGENDAHRYVFEDELRNTRSVGLVALEKCWHQSLNPVRWIMVAQADWLQRATSRGRYVPALSVCGQGTDI